MIINQSRTYSLKFVGTHINSLACTAEAKDEVAHHQHEAGYVTPPHTHKIAQELTYIVSGKLLVDGQELSAGKMFLYEPNDVADVKVLEDVDVIVVKWPSVP